MSRPPEEAHRSDFPTTRWTLISRLRLADGREAARAMEEVCRAYWYPIYAFARRMGFGPHDAEDLTQVFFQNLVAYESLQEARPEKGRMRSFLLAMVKRVISKQVRHDTAAKRGGPGLRLVSFDEKSAEERYASEPADIRDPERLFDRAWAEGVLESAAKRLEAEYAEADNLKTWSLLREFLPLGENATPYARLAAKLGVREATLRLQIHRMRKRYARLIEMEIAETVGDPSEVRGELDYLMALMAR